VGLEHEDLTGMIIGAAIEWHRRLGPGFLESIYENALTVELRHRCIAFVRQFRRPGRLPRCRSRPAPARRFVEDQIVVELKAIEELAPVHFAMVRSYLKAVGRLAQPVAASAGVI
jgi:GxxExxY protein